MKIVIIGAASASFGTGNLGSIMECKQLQGAEVALVDIHEERLGIMAKLADRYNAEYGLGMKLSATADRRQVLAGADFVVVSIAVEREDRWRFDFGVPRELGITQPYAEDGGPGGTAHALRNIATVMGIARDMERMCPDAWLLNYTNPVPRVTCAVYRHSAIKVVGLCPGIYMLEEQVAKFLDIPVGRVEIVGAGLNHFVWALDIRDSATGADLYPAFKDKVAAADPSWNPLSRALMDRVGYWPYPNDDHIAEFLNLVHHPLRKPWERWGLHETDYDGRKAWRERLFTRLREIADGKHPVTAIGRSAEPEMTTPMVRGLGLGEAMYMPAVNIPNTGYLTNLQPDGIVEVPAMVNGYGVHGVVVGDLPDIVAGWCNLHLSIQKLTADAGATGSREKALQAFMLDPMVNDLSLAEEVMDGLFKAHKGFLPQFE